MNFIDIILIIPLIYGAWRGFKKGLVIELFTLLALLVGIYCAIHFSNYTTVWLQDTFNWDGEYVPVVAFTCTLLVVGAGVFFAGKLVEKAVKVIALGMVNKILGAVFSFTKVLFIVSILIVLLEGYDKEEKFVNNELKETSLLYNPIKQTSLKTMPALHHSDDVINIIQHHPEVLSER